MNLRKFLLMAICLVLGGLSLWRMEQNAPAPDHILALEALLPDVTAEKITKYSSVRAGESFALVQGTGGAWELRRPEGALADADRAAKLLKTVSGIKVHASIERAEVEADQAIYGLHPPELLLTVEGGFGKRVLSFGKKAAVSGRRYLQLEGDGRIFLVADNIFTALNLGTDDVRDRHPVKFERAKVREFHVLRGENDYLRFERGDKWSVQTAAGKFPADKGVVEAQLDELRKLKVWDPLESTCRHASLSIL